MGKKATMGALRAVCFLALVLGLSFEAVRSPRPLPDLSGYPWVFLREGQALQPGEDPVELVAVGDVNLGRGAAGAAATLDEAAPWLQAADLALGNLECVLSGERPAAEEPGGGTAGGPYRLVAPAAAAGQLGEAGFDLLGLANNHALDRGPGGLAETYRRLEEEGIEAGGAGAGRDTAYEPVLREVRGVRVAFLAFNAIPEPNSGGKGCDPTSGRKPCAPTGSGEGWAVAGWDPELATRAIRSARSRAEAVVVSMHWGYEYQTRVDPAQREMARAVLEAGAGLVIGHHPHVVQAISVATEGGEAQVTAYSLGNFVFDQEMGQTGQGLALRAFFDERGLRAVQALPVYAGLKPRLMPLEQAGPLLERIQTRRSPITFACDAESCAPAGAGDAPARAGSAPAGAGGPAEAGEPQILEVDLTGDGAPEEVRREGERLAIYQEGKKAWQSPEEWQVADLAAGDPNLDGRYELALALWKPDENGTLRSHPFLLGHRGGIYRTVWGGSAVGEPILELEVGDVDGDGEQELIVLEERPGGEGQAVTVWRWHGWGFSRQWRSPSGRYEELAFIPGRGGSGPLLRVFQAR